MSGVITDADKVFVEQWENIAQHGNSIVRLDNRGEEKHELIHGPRTFMLTTEERMITQGRILDPANDPFLNGSFRPVVVPLTVNVESNPNALSDAEIAKVLASSEIAWKEWLSVLDSPQTLQRMIQVADGSDITLRRFKELQARLVEVSPRRRLTQKDREELEKMGGTPATDRATRAGGGRSASYR